MGNYTVLLVEDTPMIAEMVMETLRRIEEVDCHHTLTGNDAIDYLDANRPDLVLLDLNLPGKSGWQVMEFMKGRYGEGVIKVIVMTAQSDTANKLVGRLQNVERYMIKPVLPRDIIATIREVLHLDD